MHSDHCIVYVLTNEAMPDYIKIGTTRRNIGQRMRDLYTSAVPVPFECHYAAEVEITKNVEKTLHRAFNKYRVNKNREFFEIEPDAAADIIRMVAIKEVTPKDDIIETTDDKEAIQRLEQRASRFSFKMVAIIPGTILAFKNDDTLTCKVIDNRRVEYNGETTSLSSAALSALQQQGFNWKSAQGAQYWMYEGKSLKDLREQIENE